MSDPEQLGFDLREKLARIDLALAQAEESRKLLPGRLAQIEADIERRRQEFAIGATQHARLRQELRLAPWQLAIGGMTAGAALFAAAFALARLF